MRHCKHRHQLGVKKEHRIALLANLAAALFVHNRIKTTLPKAKALRPFAEKVITLAKKAAQTDDRAKKLHFYRLALAKVRSEEAVAILFTKRAQEFLNRNGGYTRIYKLAIPRIGDGAEMALIELIAANDEGYKKLRKKRLPKPKRRKKPPLPLRKKRRLPKPLPPNSPPLKAFSLRLHEAFPSDFSAGTFFFFARKAARRASYRKNGCAGTWGNGRAKKAADA